MELEETEQKAVTWDIEKEIQNLAQQNRILKSIAIRQFLNQQEEEVDDDLKAIVDKIAKAYSTGDKIHETDEEDVVILMVGYSEAIKALQKLYLYEEQHKNGNNEWILCIN